MYKLLVLLFISLFLFIKLRLIKSKNKRKFKTYKYIIKEYKKIVKKYENFTSISTLGYSIKKNKIYMIQICDSKFNNIPSTRIIFNIHGDETTGARLGILFLNFLCYEYYKFKQGTKTKLNSRIANLIKNTNLCFVPSMNPDNLFKKRNNIKNKDLNRDFILKKNYKFQPETKTIINNTNNEDYYFLLDIDCHDGAHLLCYPYDKKKIESLDENNFNYISKQYIEYNKNIKNNPSPSRFQKGYIMGSKWYKINGGIRDWMYIKNSLLGITIEFNPIKNPSDNIVKKLYNQNKDALLHYLELTLNSYRGIIIDSNGNPINNAGIYVYNYENSLVSLKKYTNKNGFFAIILAPGSYKIKIIKENYLDYIQNITIDEFQHNIKVKNKKIIMSFL